MLVPTAPTRMRAISGILGALLIASWSACGGASGGVTDIDLTPPTVTLSAPPAASTLSGSVLVQATATDNQKLARVEFRADGTPFASVLSPPFDAAWDSASVPNGSHTLEAVAVDAAGNTAADAVLITTSNTDVVSPTVSIDAPLAGATLTGAVSIQASAQDNWGVTRVEFTIDGGPLATDTTAPYAASWAASTAAPGPHTIGATAFDAAGNSTSAVIGVTVGGGGGSGNWVTLGYLGSLAPASIGTLDFTAVSSVILAFVAPTAAGGLDPTVWNVPAYLSNNVVATAHAAGATVIVSIGGGNHSANFPAIAASAALRATFAQSIVTYLNQNGLDGVDIDYEFPSNAQERLEFTQLMQAIHTAVKANDPNHTVMFGVSPGWYIDSYEWNLLGQYSDYAFYMGYDWSNPYNGPLTNPGQIQNTNGGNQIEASCRGALDFALTSGYPASKLVLGMPFYSKPANSAWKTVRATWAAAGPWTPHATAMETQINADWWTSPEAIPRKLEAVLLSAQSVLSGSQTLAGTGFWEWGHEDPASPDLSAAIKNWIATH